MTTSSYIIGKVPGLSAVHMDELGIGLRAEGLWRTSPELLEHAPVNAVGDNGGSPCPVQVEDPLGDLQGTSGGDSSLFYRAVGMGDGRTSPSMGSRLYGQIHDCLTRDRRVSRITADSVLGRVCGRCRVSSRDVTRDHLPQLIDTIKVALSVFVERGTLTSILKDLEILGGSATVRPLLVAAHQRVERNVLSITDDEYAITIDDEYAIDTARTAALDLAREIGLGTVDSVKVATVVSELARNIYQYAKPGTIELIPLRNGIKIIARDSGPGIPHIDDVLGGKWRSKTGMGLGILGSKRLIPNLEVDTVVGGGDYRYCNEVYRSVGRRKGYKKA